MIKNYFKKVIALGIIAASVVALNPIGASASWKQDGYGWWYTEGNSWATGWREINGKWYYFDSNGYMAHDTTINGYIIGSDGARQGEVNTTGIYTWGKDLKHMNFQGNHGEDYKYSDPSANKKVYDNLNNEYTNYLTLRQYAYDESYSYIEFPLNGEYKQFTSLVGLTKDYQDALESGNVRIYLDNEKVYDEELSSGDMLRNIKLDLTGKNKIKFYFGDTVTTIGNGYGYTVEIGFFNGQFTK